MAIESEQLDVSRPSWFVDLIRTGRLSGVGIWALAAIGVALTIATAGIMTATTNRAEAAGPGTVYAVLLADFIFLLTLFGLLAWRVAALIGERRSRTAGAALHLRLTGVFALVAMAPTILIAIFGTISLNNGLEAWFSRQVGTVVNNSLETAQAYAREHRGSVGQDAFAMAANLRRAAASAPGGEVTAQMLRGMQAQHRFAEAYLIDSEGRIALRGDFSYYFTYDQPSVRQLADARLGDFVFVEDRNNNEFRGLVYLDFLADRYLYITRPVDGEVLLLLDEAAEAVNVYNRAEASRGRILSTFALVYIGFALLVVTAAVLVGLWFAERLARPIGALATAAERVGAGDLDARVPEDREGDEVALLSRVFNRMTAQVKGQRDALVEANRETEARRNFIETVLAGVSAGVIGLDADGRVEMANAAAEAMLGGQAPTGSRLEEFAPAAADVFARAKVSISGEAHAQVEAFVGEERREFLIRVAARSSRDLRQGFVLTIDDLTALVSAQREAAWGDVARRIAHEIKNPLTPIQLSAERLRRKFAPQVEAGRENFEQYADVIVRQASEIRRMVDEFSRFARMPTPSLAPVDLASILRDAVLLQQAARPDIDFEIIGADQAENAPCDAGMVSQALTNLLKNASEAIDGRRESEGEDSAQGKIRAELFAEGRAVHLIVEDNGPGLPAAARARLTEPYVTTREKGTGLGLAIVKKIAEQHKGALKLADSNRWGGQGAKITLTLPRGPQDLNDTEAKTE